MAIKHEHTVSIADKGDETMIHAADWLADHAVDAGTALYGFCPVGAVVTWAGVVANPPSGFLLCDGTSLLRAGTYADLFSAIGTTYGAADGTHFNLPDLRDKFVVGAKQDDSSLPKASITGGLTQSYTPPAWTLTHSMTIADHTLAHTDLSVAAHPALTHAALGIADHPSQSMTISVGPQGAANTILVTTITKTASRTTVVSSSAHAWTNPTGAAVSHNITANMNSDQHSAATHGITQADAHAGAAVTHSFTVPSAHSSTPVPAFIALGYVIRYA